MELSDFEKGLNYKDFMKSWHEKDDSSLSMPEKSRLLSKDWKEYKLKYKEDSDNAENAINEPEKKETDPKSEPESEENAIIEPKSELESVAFEFEGSQDGVFLGSDSKHQSEEQKKESANVQISALNESPEDYARLTNRIHKALNNVVLFFSRGKISLKQEEISDLSESGAFLARKYDTKGFLGRKFPETFYILTLLSVTLRVTLDYFKLKDKEKAPEKSENEFSARSRVEIPPAK